jgi:hypothetical protein
MLEHRLRRLRCRRYGQEKLMLRRYDYHHHHLRLRLKNQKLNFHHHWQSLLLLLKKQELARQRQHLQNMQFLP